MRSPRRKRSYPLPEWSTAIPLTDRDTHGHLVRLEITVERDDGAVHTEHLRICLHPTIADLLGCRQIQLEHRELCVHVATHEAGLLSPRYSAASKT